MAPRGMRDSDDCYQATSRGPITYCSDAGQPSLYGSEAPTPTKRQKGPWSWPALATCRLRQGHWHKHRVWVPLLVILPLLVIYTLSRALMHWNSRGWSEAACNPAGRPPVISDIYVIHSYWSAERRDNAPNICKRIAEQTDTYLSRVPCMTFPGYHATTATDAEIRKLVQDRIVGPESHTRPQRWFTRLLHATGLAKSIPLFHPVTESIYHKSYLGTAASHALVVANWTTELMARVPSPLERSKRNLLLFEDDALVTPEVLRQITDTLAHMDRCYDVYSLDSKDTFCNMPLALRSLGSWLVPSSWGRPLPPRPTRTRIAFSRNTGMVLSYKGALALFSGLPVTHEIDLWFRNQMTDGILKIHVACPKIVTSVGLPTVV